MPLQGKTRKGGTFKSLILSIRNYGGLLRESRGNDIGHVETGGMRPGKTKMKQGDRNNEAAMQHRRLPRLSGDLAMGKRHGKSGVYVYCCGGHCASSLCHVFWSSFLCLLHVLCRMLVFMLASLFPPRTNLALLALTLSCLLALLLLLSASKTSIIRRLYVHGKKED